MGEDSNHSAGTLHFSSSDNGLSSDESSRAKLIHSGGGIPIGVGGSRNKASLILSKPARSPLGVSPKALYKDDDDIKHTSTSSDGAHNLPGLGTDHKSLTVDPYDNR
jgi:hypothetical protein